MASSWRARLDDTRQMLSIEWVLTSIEVGIVAGVVAGIPMPCIAMIAALATGEDIWAPPRAIVEMFFGELRAGKDVELIIISAGSVAHLLLSAVFGVMYALVAGVTRRAQTTLVSVVSGMAWGLGRWASNTFFVAPRLPGGELITSAMPAWTWAVGHLLYGAVLGLLFARWQHYIAMDSIAMDSIAMDSTD